MSNIEPNIIDPGRPIPPSPDLIPPLDDPDDDLVDDDAVREPDFDTPPIEPDPEEGRRDLPEIRRGRGR